MTTAVHTFESKVSSRKNDLPAGKKKGGERFAAYCILLRRFISCRMISCHFLQRDIPKRLDKDTFAEDFIKPDICKLTIRESYLTDKPDSRLSHSIKSRFFLEALIENCHFFTSLFEVVSAFERQGRFDVPKCQSTILLYNCYYYFITNIIFMCDVSPGRDK